MRKRLIIVLDDPAAAVELMNLAAAVAVELHLVTEEEPEAGVILGPAPKRLPAQLKRNPLQAPAPAPLYERRKRKEQKPRTLYVPSREVQARIMKFARTATKPFRTRDIAAWNEEHNVNHAVSSIDHAMRALRDSGAIIAVGGDRFAGGYLYSLAKPAAKEPAKPTPTETSS